MRKITLCFLLTLASIGIFAQAPQAFSYQAIARDAKGEVLANRPVSIRLTIVENGTTAIYSEVQKAETNQFGLFTVTVGKGGTSVLSSFDAIDWGTGSKSLKVEFDPTGGESYIDLGADRLLSVPYALYAANCGGGNVTAKSLVSGGFVRDSISNSLVIVHNVGNLANDNFVFGSSQLDDTAGTVDDKRMFFDKAKGAFRVGYTTDSSWNNVNIGNYSFGMGNNTKAIGIGSSALGLQSVASGDYAFAAGNADTASGAYSFALGKDNKASGVYSVASGFHTNATNQQAFTLGNYTTASGIASVAVGGNTIASGDYAFVSGNSDTASGAYSFALGKDNKASGVYSLASGFHTMATNQQAVAFGNYTVASGIASVATGGQTIATADYAFAAGSADTASGRYAFVTGRLNKSSGNAAFASGFRNSASGAYSVALGYRSSAVSGVEMTVGRYNTLYMPLDTLDWNLNDRLFSVGNGTSDTTRSNALTILKNGNVAIGNIIPTATLHIDGDIRFSSLPISGSAGEDKILIIDSVGYIRQISKTTIAPSILSAVGLLISSLGGTSSDNIVTVDSNGVMHSHIANQNGAIISDGSASNNIVTIDSSGVMHSISPSSFFGEAVSSNGGSSSDSLVTIDSNGNLHSQSISDITNLSISGNQLSVGGDTIILPDNDNQTLTLTNGTLSISGGNSVTLISAGGLTSDSVVTVSNGIFHKRAANSLSGLTSGSATDQVITIGADGQLHSTNLATLLAPLDYTNTGNTSGGTYTFYITDDKTATGNALFSTIDYVGVSAATSDFGEVLPSVSYKIVNNKTIQVKVSNLLGISLLGINLGLSVGTIPVSILVKGH